VAAYLGRVYLESTLIHKEESTIFDTQT